MVKRKDKEAMFTCRANEHHHPIAGSWRCEVHTMNRISGNWRRAVWRLAFYENQAEGWHALMSIIPDWGARRRTELHWGGPWDWQFMQVLIQPVITLDLANWQNLDIDLPKNLAERLSLYSRPLKTHYMLWRVWWTVAIRHCRNGKSRWSGAGSGLSEE